MMPALVADIGATHARFALAGAGGLGSQRVRLETADWNDAGALLHEALARLGAKAEVACLAIAGPVRDGRGTITNGTLNFDASTLAAVAGCPVRLINDFHALALSLPHLSRLRQLGGSTPAEGVRAVLGPGSGLGMSVLVPDGQGWRVLASEGGHADLAPGSPLELELLGILQAEHGQVSWESVLSGPGLVNLYRAVCALWGSAPDDLAAADVTRLGVDAQDPVCHQTLEVFCGLLGAAAGNFAVTVAAWGGVYLGGGIVPRIADFVVTSAVRRRFDERGVMSLLIRDVPLWLIEDDDPGLIGAAAAAEATRY